MNEELPPHEAVDALIDAIPENVYDPCPCGCGLKWRYVVKDPAHLAEHEQRFYEKWSKEHESH